MWNSLRTRLFLVSGLLIFMVGASACGSGIGQGGDSSVNNGTEILVEPTESVSLEGVTETQITEIPSEVTETEAVTGEYDFTLCFAGDISLDEKAVTTAQLDANEGDITKCISPELIAIMQSADIMCLKRKIRFCV